MKWTCYPIHPCRKEAAGIYIAVCDDEAAELNVLTDLLDRWSRERQKNLRYKSFQSATELLDTLQREPFTLYLMDVMMPGLNGMDATREIRRLDAAAGIIFLTASTEFAYQSYSVRAMNYILKPIDAEKLFPVLDRLALEEQRPQDGLTVKCGSTLVRLPYSQLAYVEINHKHLYFNLTDGSVHEVFGTLNSYEPLLLSRPEFLRAHRSYIINMLQIKELSPAGIRTFSGKTIPVSRALYSQIQKDYMNFIFTKTTDTNIRGNV